MKRYHKKIYFPKEHYNLLIDLTNQFNKSKHFNKSNHGITQLKNRFEMMDILQFLKDDIHFKYDDIFEYYTEKDNIIKVCYKIPYNQYQDLIIVLSKEKTIVTLYLNNKGDNHKTLKNELYCTI